MEHLRTPAKHPRILLEQQRRKIVVFFKENLNLTLIHLAFQLKVEISFIADMNCLFIYLFIYFSLFKVGLQEVNRVFN